jgi:EmrB/QacA subfamily drug resistance transporter
VALVLILLAAFMDLMDVTILNVVLPTIETELRAGPAAVEWMLAGYTLAQTLGLITGARLGDLLGHRRVFLAGLAGFALASALCGAATSPQLLVAARILQGLCAAAMLPQVLSQIQLLYPPAQRGPAMAAYAALTPLGAAVGSVLGPALLAANLAGTGWRLVFYVNVALAAVVLAFAYPLLPEGRAERAARLDLAGLGLSTLGLVLLLYPLVTAADRTSWPAWAIASLATGVMVLAGFVVHQRRLAAAGGDPILRVGLLRIRSLSGGLLVQLLFLVPIMGFFLAFLQFVQLGLGASPLAAGLILLPWSVLVALLAGVSASLLLPRLGRATVHLGLVVLATGFALLALVGAGAGAGTGWPALMPGVVVGAAGMGLVASPVAVLALRDVPAERAGTGSALFGTTSQLGASIGVAALGSVFFRRLAVDDRSGPGAYGDALAVSLWVGVALLGLAFAAAFLLPGRRATRTANRGAPRRRPARDQDECSVSTARASGARSGSSRAASSASRSAASLVGRAAANSSFPAGVTSV